MAPTKNIFLVLFFFLVSGSILGQNLGITFGAGYNTQVKSADQFFPVSYSPYNRTSPYIGLVYRDSLSRRFIIKASLYYIQRGVRYNYDFKSAFYNLHADQKFTCHYISFPIKIAYNIRNFFVGVGLEGSILLKGHYDMVIENSDPSGYYSKQVLNKWYGTLDKVFQPVDAGYNFNIGYRKKNIEVELNMFHGLIAPGNFFIFTSQHFEFQYLTQQTFMLGINYYLVFKRKVRT